MVPSTHIVMNVSDKRFSARAKKVKKVLTEALVILKKKNVSLEVHLLTNKEMVAINKATRGKNVSTNVLSFEAGGFKRIGENGTEYLGEIYLAPNTVTARKENISFLTVHGLFHLLGYTHEGKRDTITMERAEDALLAKLAERLV